MALILYANGLIEEYKPQNLVFSEEELIKIFEEYSIVTSRVIAVPNCWCIYGNSKENTFIDYNKLASAIIEKQIFTHALFVHDSELDPDWKITDDVIYKSYAEFLEILKRKINEAAVNILHKLENSEDYENKISMLPKLETIGSTKDNRILFGFNPLNQSKEFFENEEYYLFSKKVYNFLLDHKQEKEPFVIYEDKQAIIIVEKEQVKTFLSQMIEKFKSKEEYEICTDISKIMKSWINSSKPPRKSRSKKSSNEDTQ